MSLLLEALKKAEKAKEDAQRQSGKSPADASASLELDPPPEPRHVFTKDELPSITTTVEITSEGLGGGSPAPERTAPTSPPPSSPRAAPARSAAAESAEPAPEARAKAKKVFEAKFKEPNPKLPFYIVMGLLGAFAAGTVAYFWVQLRPPPPLVNPNPPRNASEPAVAVPESKPVATAPEKPAAALDIPGLPPTKPAAETSAATAAPVAGAAGPAAPVASTAPAAPASPAATLTAQPAVVALPEPRQARPAATKAAPAREAAAAPQPGAPRTPVATRRPAPAVDPSVESGYAAYQSGDFPAARRGYERALANDPSNRDALLGLAAVEVRAQNLAAAETLYRRLLRADPRDSLAQAGLLSLRPDSADPVASESRVRTLIAGDPDSAALHFTLGGQLAQQGRWPEAQQAYFRALSLEPDNPDFAYNLAVSLDHLRQPKLALEYYRRALALAEKRTAAFDRPAALARTQELAR